MPRRFLPCPGRGTTEGTRRRTRARGARHSSRPTSIFVPGCWRMPNPRKNEVHRGFRCTPRMAGSGGGFTTRDTVSCASARAGRTGLPRGRRERQADRSPAGGHPHFFWNTFPAAAPRSSPFRLHPMRDPANRPLTRTSAGTPPAFSRAQASPDRASGVRGGRLRCACGRRSAPGWGRGWRDRYLPKNSHGPLPRLHPSAVPDASTHAWNNPCPPPCPDTIPLHRESSRPWRSSAASVAIIDCAASKFHCIASHLALGDRDAQFATKSAMNQE
jgi:hypothetical protein